MDRSPERGSGSRQENPYLPDLSRRRRRYARQGNPIVWLMPVAALALAVAAVLRLVPDVSMTPRDFGRFYAETHHAALRHLPRETRPVSRIEADADSVALRLRLTPGLARRAAETGAHVVDVRLSTAYYEHQLELVVRVGGEQPVSLFQERFSPRTLDTYRRIDSDDEHFFIASALEAKGVMDSVLVWTEPGMLLTLVGRAPEDSLTAFAHRLRMTLRESDVPLGATSLVPTRVGSSNAR